MQLRSILTTPLSAALGRYRFPRAKARQVARTYCRFRDQQLKLRTMVSLEIPSDSLRNCLTSVVDGLGPKQASMFLRDIGRADDLAIIDRHVLAYMKVVGLVSRHHTDSLTRKSYLDLEEELRRYAEFLNLPLGVLDRAIWVVVRIAKREQLV
jgi:N-glycosylase/DNA lyase